MGSTTTIRVDRELHAQLVELADASDRSIVETVREAVEALNRQRFWERVRGDLAALRENEDAWNEYLAEAEETSVDDGIA